VSGRGARVAEMTTDPLGRTTTKECDLCGTMLEFEQDGQRFAFTAHTPELCRAETKRRIADLKQALVDQRALYEHAIRGVTRQADRTLDDAGLETLTQRAKRHEHEAMALATQWRDGPIELQGLER